MEKKTISFKEFDNLDKLTRWGSTATCDDLINIHKYLLDKVVVDYNNEIVKDKPSDEFIMTALYRVRFAPKFSASMEEFIKSEYLSNCLKNNIYYILSKLDGYDSVLKLLSSDINLYEYKLLDLIKIYNGLIEYYSNSKRRKYEENNLAIECFNQYMFFQDTVAAVDYIKTVYPKNELFKEILANSGIVPSEGHYSCLGMSAYYLNHEHLISVYNKIKKYYPEVTDEFVKLVNNMDNMSPNIFIANYFIFVDNDFKIDEKDIIKDEKISKEYRRRNVRSIIKTRQNKIYDEWKKKKDLSTSYEIKKRFIELVNNQKSSNRQYVLK